MHRGETRRVYEVEIVGHVQHLTAMSREPEIVAQQRFRGSCAHQHDDLGIDRTQFGEQPGATRDHLGPARRLVDAAFTAFRLLEFEVLDRVGDIHRITVYSGSNQRLIQQPACGTNKRLSRPVLLVARLLTDEHHRRRRRTSAENDLVGVAVQATSLTPHGRIGEYRQFSGVGYVLGRGRRRHEQ